jgi:hypothetical protein
VIDKHHWSYPNPIDVLDTLFQGATSQITDPAAFISEETLQVITQDRRGEKQALNSFFKEFLRAA